MAFASTYQHVYMELRIPTGLLRKAPLSDQRYKIGEFNQRGEMFKTMKIELNVKIVHLMLGPV